MRADEVRIEAPCDEDWDRMRPEAEGQRRWCEHCERHVHDLSQMDELAARAFLRANAGLDLCISYCEDEAGQIVFRPSSPGSERARSEASIVPLERVRRRPSPSPVVEAAKLASAASFAALLGACTPHHDEGQMIRVEEPAGSTAAPMVVIPTKVSDRPDAASIVEDPPTAEEPCEAPTPPKNPLRKKGKRKIGSSGSSSDPLGGL